MRLYGEIIPELCEGMIDRTGAQTMFYLTCTLAQYGVSRLKIDICGLWYNKHYEHLICINDKTNINIH